MFGFFSASPRLCGINSAGILMLQRGDGLTKQPRIIARAMHGSFEGNTADAAAVTARKIHVADCEKPIGMAEIAQRNTKDPRVA